MVGEIEKLLVRALPKALCCLFEQDRFYPHYLALVQTRKTSRRNCKIIDVDVKHQALQNKTDLVRHVSDYGCNILT